MSHAGQCLNTARRVLAHVRAYLDSGQYGECRDNEQAQACESVGMAVHLPTEFYFVFLFCIILFIINTIIDTIKNPTV